MNWWRTARMIDDFEDRNRANDSIHRLEKVSDTLLYCSELIFQTGRGARGMVNQIANSKILSTYPDVVDILFEADKVALDAPKKFAELCQEAADKLKYQTDYLKDERTKFIQDENPNRLKGWVDEHRE